MSRDNHQIKYETDLKRVKPTPTTMDKLEESLQGGPTETRQVVAIMNANQKVYFDTPADFLKMLDHMRDVVMNKLPEWNTTQLIFVISDNGINILVDNPTAQHEPDPQVTKQ